MLVGYGQLLLGLSILVILHELGHFLSAKWFKMRVDKFYLFFDPWFSLFKFKKGGTEYGIGWLPLGGYVRIRGMVDESMQDGLESDPQPWEFRAKPAWQRLIVMSGGIIMNLLVAWVIFSALNYVYGSDHIPAKNYVDGVYIVPEARQIGLKNGDKIVKIDSKDVPDNYDYHQIAWDMMLEGVKEVTVDRNGELINVTVPEDFDDMVVTHKQTPLFLAPTPFIADSIIPGKFADSAGFKNGDTLLAFNNKPIYSFHHGAELLQKSKSKPGEFLVGRKEGVKELFGYVSSEGTIGVQVSFRSNNYESLHTDYTLPEAIGKGFSDVGMGFVKTMVSMKLLFTKNGAKQMSSVLSAGKRYGSKFNWYSFWGMTGLLSIGLAFFNLLPIPGLDGGHIMFTLYEMITRKKPSVKVMQTIQLVGMIFLISVMIFAVSNDIRYDRL